MHPWLCLSRLRSSLSDPVAISSSQNICLNNLLIFSVSLSLNRSIQLHAATLKPAGLGGAFKRQGVDVAPLPSAPVHFFLQKAVVKAVACTAKLANGKRVADGYVPTFPKEQEEGEIVFFTCVPC